MKEVLIEKLHLYVQANHPDILIPLQEGKAVAAWLWDKVDNIQDMLETMQAEGHPAYIVEECCMKELTAGLGISKYNYISSIIEEEFEETYNWLLTSALLAHEVINLITSCAPAFEEFGFDENSEDNNLLRAAVTGILHDHFTIPVTVS